MNDLITVFKMIELSPETRIRVIEKLGKLINYQYGSNVSEPIVAELIHLLKIKSEDKKLEDQSYEAIKRLGWQN